MSFVVPKVAPYIVPTQEPHRPKNTERVQSVNAVVGVRPGAKWEETDAARVEISDQARQLARKHLESLDERA